MADKTISALTGASTPLAGTEVLPIVQGGSTVKVSIGNVTAGRPMSALSGSFGTGTPAYSIGGTQVGITNTSANAYLSIYGGVGSTNGGFLLGGNNAENFANLFWSNGSNFMQIATTPVSSKVQFNIAGVVAGDITTNGFAPAAGKGIDFSANSHAAGMTSELLNDYEEGTWTAGVSFGGGSTGVTYSNNAGYYTRVGNIVTVSCYLVLSNKGSSTGAARITGLPFTCVNNAAGYSALSVLPLNVTFIGQLSGYANVNDTTIDLVPSTGVALTDVGFANNSTFIISLTYRAA
jgi:hypothetical protein